MTPSHSDLRDRLEEELTKTRRDALLFSVLTVLLTPLFLVVAVFIILAMGLYVDSPYVHRDNYVDSYVTTLNIALIFMFATFFIRPKAQWQTRKADLYWIGGGIAAVVLMLAWSYGTGFAETRPGLYWSVYGLLAVTMLGLVGYAYVPHDHYYLGLWNGAMDDWSTFGDDVDRGHYALGFAVAVPRLILGSYGGIIDNIWLWRGLTDAEIRRAADVLHAYAECDPARARGILQLTDEKTRVHVIRALCKLGHVRGGKNGLRLSTDGEKFVGINPWH